MIKKAKESKKPRKVVTKDSKKKQEKIKEKYIRAIGRRKTSVAEVKIFLKKPEKENFTINKKPWDIYFPEKNIQKDIFLPIEKTDSLLLEKNKIDVIVRGGGKISQAGAVRLAISRALILKNEDLRQILKSHKLLVSDSRKKERKKFGFKKARRRPQWSKR